MNDAVGPCRTLLLERISPRGIGESRKQEWDLVSGSYRSGGDHREDGPHHGRGPAGPGGDQTSYGGDRAGRGHRTGSGSHRVVRDPRAGRRVAIMLAGVGVAAVACVLAAVALLGSAGKDADGAAGQVVGSSAAESTSMAKVERSLVPHACTMVGDDLAARLAPDASRTQADSYQSNDRQNQRVWGAYIADRKRQLTVE